MNFHQRHATFVLGLVVLSACTVPTGGDDGSSEAAIEAVAVADPCAPGAATVDFATHPNAVCAVRTEPLPNNVGPSARGVTASAAVPQLAPIPGYVRPSCGGRFGHGFTSCGLYGNEDCCPALPVPRPNAPFQLGKYEVTAARFRVFADTVGNNLRQFYPAFGTALPANRAELDVSVGAACQARGNVAAYGARDFSEGDIIPKMNSVLREAEPLRSRIINDATQAALDEKPMNCVIYQLAAAFCAFDGGRLPTNAEWVYAASGGEGRRYAWGNANHDANHLVTDLSHAGSNFTWPEYRYFANGYNSFHISPPGRKPAGTAKWGHGDMTGNLLEWMLDTSKGGGIVRGGSWEGHNDENSQSYQNYPLSRSYGSVGFRCVY